jgi:hypothetical protein
MKNLGVFDLDDQLVTANPVVGQHIAEPRLGHSTPPYASIDAYSDATIAAGTGHRNVGQ